MDALEDCSDEESSVNNEHVTGTHPETDTHRETGNEAASPGEDRVSG